MPCSEIKSQHLKLVVDTLPEEQRVVLDGTLFQPVEADDSNWSISTEKGQRVLTVELEKAAPMGGALSKAPRWLVLTR